MAKGRKNGCPVNIRNWLIYIQDKSQVSETWLRIYGLTSMTATTGSDTEEGSRDTDVWAEPYVTKRNGSVSLEGKPVVVESTGVRDAGQDMLTQYANYAGCDGDATLKFVDPYGHAWIADYIVTNHETSSDSSNETESWDLEQVGEVEVQPYVNISSIAVKSGVSSAATLSIAMGSTPTLITVEFTPTTASNKRFRVTNSKRSVATVGNITESSFTITPVSVGTSTITVTTVEGGKTASIALTVTASA